MPPLRSWGDSNGGRGEYLLIPFQAQCVINELISDRGAFPNRDRGGMEGGCIGSGKRLKIPRMNCKVTLESKALAVRW